MRFNVFSTILFQQSFIPLFHLNYAIYLRYLYHRNDTTSIAQRLCSSPFYYMIVRAL
jgi:hypothetical protein